MTQNNYDKHYRAQTLADTNSKYRLGRRIVDLEEKLKEYEITGITVNKSSTNTDPENTEPYINNCICGVDISEKDLLIDSLYPANRERTKWQLGCAVHNCGCGRHVYADSKEEVIERWNHGITDEYIRN